MPKLSGKTKQLAIIGDPVEHSKSPQMHKVFAELTNEDYIYTALHVKSENLEEAIKGIRALNFAGVNVTAPHKFNVMGLLDEISDEALKFGSVNTVVNKNGRLVGYNTDAHGFYKSLIKAGFEIKDKDVLIFGAGGATQPVVVLFAMIGAKSITVLNRTPERSKRLADYVYKMVGYTVETEKKKTHYDVVINTTSAGMAPQTDKMPGENLDFIDENTNVADMIYNPWETLFLKEAKKRGANTVNGMGMLIYQGILAYELFTGSKLPDNAYEEAEKVVKPDTRNIVLTGYMASGKSTIGRKLSELTGRTLIDTDTIVEKNAGITISEIFEKYGEEHFRKLEAEACKIAAGEEYAIIATGGGAVLRGENIEALRKNGIIFNLEPDEETIINRLFKKKTDRPLVKDAASEAILNRFRDRKPFYDNCDRKIYVNDSKLPEDFAKEILGLKD